MEPKTITILGLAPLLLSFVIAYIAMRRRYNKQTDSMWNTIHKLHEENSRLNIELDITAKQRDDNRTTITRLERETHGYSSMYWTAVKEFSESEKTVKKQRNRIAELIELCNKLQPDLAAQHDENINRRFKVDNNWFEKIKQNPAGYTKKIHVIDRKHIENMGDVSRIGIVNGKIDVKYKDR